MNGKEIQKLRQKLKMDEAEFAQLLNMDVRSIRRWEKDEVVPTGPAESILLALEDKLENTKGKETQELIEFIVKAAAIGGLAYLLIKLFNNSKGSK